MMKWLLRIFGTSFDYKKGYSHGFEAGLKFYHEKVLDIYDLVSDSAKEVSKQLEKDGVEE